MATPQVPPRPIRQKPSSEASLSPEVIFQNPQVPQIPPRPAARAIDRSEVNRDAFAPSPLNDPPFLPKTTGGESPHNGQVDHASESVQNLPDRPPSVKLPSIGQEGNEYADIVNMQQEPQLSKTLSGESETTTSHVGSDLPLHAPKPSLSQADQKARIQNVTHTDSFKSASHGVGRQPSVSIESQGRGLKSKSSTSFRSPSAASGERPDSTQPEPQGIPEIGIQVPMYPNAGDVQAPSPSLHGSFPPPSSAGLHSEGRSRHHGRTRSGREVFHGPPGSYGLHGHGYNATDKFEKAWYEKHPEALVQEGVYSPALSNARGEYVLSREELNKLVQDTANRAVGFGTKPDVVGLPDEQIGYMASEEYASRIASRPTSSYATKAHGNNSQSHIDSPLRTANFPDDIGSKAASGARDVPEALQKLAESHSDSETIHVDASERRYNKVSGGQGTLAATVDLGPKGGNSEHEGGYVDEQGHGVPILASDEIRPDSAWQKPAVAPVSEERRSSQDFGNRLGSRPGSTNASRPTSRPTSVHGHTGLSRFTSHEEYDTHTPLDDVEEYEPLFEDDEKTLKKPQTQVERLKHRPDARRRFPSQDIWEDTPNSLQLQTEVQTPPPPEEQNNFGTQKSVGFEHPDAEAARKGEVSEREKAKLIPNEERLAKSRFKPHIRSEMERPGLSHRFPSQDIWEDSPDSARLETTVGEQHAEEDAGLAAGAVVQTGALSRGQPREGATSGASVQPQSIPGAFPVIPLPQEENFSRELHILNATESAKALGPSETNITAETKPAGDASRQAAKGGSGLASQLAGSTGSTGTDAANTPGQYKDTSAITPVFLDPPSRMEARGSESTTAGVAPISSSYPISNSMDHSVVFTAPLSVPLTQGSSNKVNEASPVSIPPASSRPSEGTLATGAIPVSASAAGQKSQDKVGVTADATMMSIARSEREGKEDHIDVALVGSDSSQEQKRKEDATNPMVVSDLTRETEHQRNAGGSSRSAVVVAPATEQKSEDKAGSAIDSASKSIHRPDTQSRLSHSGVTAAISGSSQELPQGFAGPAAVSYSAQRPEDRSEVGGSPTPVQVTTSTTPRQQVEHKISPVNNSISAHVPRSGTRSEDSRSEDATVTSASSQELEQHVVVGPRSETSHPIQGSEIRFDASSSRALVPAPTSESEKRSIASPAPISTSIPTMGREFNASDSLAITCSVKSDEKAVADAHPTRVSAQRSVDASGVGESSLDTIVGAKLDDKPTTDAHSASSALQGSEDKAGVNDSRSSATAAARQEERSIVSAPPGSTAIQKSEDAANARDSSVATGGAESDGKAFTDTLPDSAVSVRRSENKSSLSDPRSTTSTGAKSDGRAEHDAPLAVASTGARRLEDRSGPNDPPTVGAIAKPDGKALQDTSSASDYTGIRGAKDGSGSSDPPSTLAAVPKLIGQAMPNDSSVSNSSDTRAVENRPGLSDSPSVDATSKPDNPSIFPTGIPKSKDWSSASELPLTIRSSASSDDKAEHGSYSATTTITTQKPHDRNVSHDASVPSSAPIQTSEGEAIDAASPRLSLLRSTVQMMESSSGVKSSSPIVSSIAKADDKTVTDAPAPALAPIATRKLGDRNVCNDVPVLSSVLAWKPERETTESTSSRPNPFQSTVPMTDSISGTDRSSLIVTGGTKIDDEAVTGAPAPPLASTASWRPNDRPILDPVATSTPVPDQLPGSRTTNAVTPRSNPLQTTFRRSEDQTGPSRSPPSPASGTNLNDTATTGAPPSSALTTAQDLGQGSVSDATAASTSVPRKDLKREITDTATSRRSSLPTQKSNVRSMAAVFDSTPSRKAENRAVSSTLPVADHGSHQNPEDKTVPDTFSNSRFVAQSMTGHEGTTPGQEAERQAITSTQPILDSTSSQKPESRPVSGSFSTQKPVAQAIAGVLKSLQGQQAENRLTTDARSVSNSITSEKLEDNAIFSATTTAGSDSNQQVGESSLSNKSFNSKSVTDARPVPDSILKGKPEQKPLAGTATFAGLDSKEQAEDSSFPRVFPGPEAVSDIKVDNEATTGISYANQSAPDQQLEGKATSTTSDVPPMKRLASGQIAEDKASSDVASLPPKVDNQATARTSPINQSATGQQLKDKATSTASTAPPVKDLVSSQIAEDKALSNAASLPLAPDSFLNPKMADATGSEVSSAPTTEASGSRQASQVKSGIAGAAPAKDAASSQLIGDRTKSDFAKVPHAGDPKSGQEGVGKASTNATGSSLIKKSVFNSKSVDTSTSSTTDAPPAAASATSQTAGKKATVNVPGAEIVEGSASDRTDGKKAAPGTAGTMLGQDFVPARESGEEAVSNVDTIPAKDPASSHTAAAELEAKVASIWRAISDLETELETISDPAAIPNSTPSQSMEGSTATNSGRVKSLIPKRRLGHGIVPYVISPSQSTFSSNSHERTHANLSTISGQLPANAMQSGASESDPLADTGTAPTRSQEDPTSTGKIYPTGATHLLERNQLTAGSNVPPRDSSFHQGTQESRATNFVPSDVPEEHIASNKANSNTETVPSIPPRPTKQDSSASSTVHPLMPARPSKHPHPHPHHRAESPYEHSHLSESQPPPSQEARERAFANSQTSPPEGQTRSPSEGRKPPTIPNRPKPHHGPGRVDKGRTFSPEENITSGTARRVFSPSEETEGAGSLSATGNEFRTGVDIRDEVPSARDSTALQVGSKQAAATDLSSKGPIASHPIADNLSPSDTNGSVSAHGTQEGPTTGVFGPIDEVSSSTKDGGIAIAPHQQAQQSSTASVDNAGGTTQIEADTATQAGARGSHSTTIGASQDDDGDITTPSSGFTRDVSSPPTVPKAKPAIPARPAGSKIAALQAGFMSDLNNRLKLGPQPPAKPADKSAEEEKPEEKAPLADARKARAKRPTRRKPAASPSPNAAASTAAETDAGIISTGAEAQTTSKPSQPRSSIVQPICLWQVPNTGVFDPVHADFVEKVEKPASLDGAVEAQEPALPKTEAALPVGQEPPVEEAETSLSEPATAAAPLESKPNEVIAEQEVEVEAVPAQETAADTVT